MDSSNKTDPNSFKEAKEIRKLLKLKDSKVGHVILKANVLEQAKLGTKLDAISHHQRSQEVNLTWKKQLLLKRQRNTLIKSKSTSVIKIPPSRLPPLLPPIPIKPAHTSVSRQQNTSMAQHEKNLFAKCNEIPMDAHNVGLRERNVVCFKTESSEKALLQWKRAIKKTREQIRKSKVTLPPLMLEKTHFDYEKDPRFARLIEQLVPNITRRKSDGDVCRKVDDEDDDELSDIMNESDEERT